ncbi:MAG TPA: hypothetical protein VNJ07_01640 [Chitinophagales bacterium]|nr:hypothetical protein [Chitinophagales bacterium]
MKPLCFLLLLALFSYHGFGQSENQIEKQESAAKNYFYLSPFNLIVSQFLVGYERDFSRNHGLAILPGVIVDDGYYSGVELGVSAEMQYRYHMVSVANPRGRAKNDFRFDFYFAPFAAYQYLQYNDEIDSYYNGYNYVYMYDSVNIHGVSGGILFGTRFVFFERFSIDAYAGGGVKYSDNKVNYSDIFREGYTGIIGKVNLQIGVAF